MIHSFFIHFLFIFHSFFIHSFSGLGTSTSKEAKEYFSDMLRHRIKFRHNDEQDDHCIDLAFSKKKIDQRKEWLTNWMEEGKRRKELGLPEVYLYEKDTRAVTYADFVNKELVRIYFSSFLFLHTNYLSSAPIKSVETSSKKFDL